jgi:hypothetical protein
MTRETLSPPEFRRFIAKMGGLWSTAMLTRVCGPRLRRASESADFPDSVWEVGRTRLYTGWDVVNWLRGREQWYEATLLEVELKGLERRKFATQA